MVRWHKFLNLLEREISVQQCPAGIILHSAFYKKQRLVVGTSYQRNAMPFLLFWGFSDKCKCRENNYS